MEINRLTEKHKALNSEAIQLINEIIALETLYFHKRHLAKGIINETTIPSRLQELLHKSYELNDPQAFIPFVTFMDNFLDMSLHIGIKFSNPFFIVFHENRSEQLYKLFNKEY